MINKINKKYLISAIIILSLILLPSITQSASVGVKPSQLNLELQTGKEIQSQILIINVEQQPAIYQIYPDDFAGNIKPSPSEFRLEANATQIVDLKIKFNNPGSYVTNLSVIAKPLTASNLAVSSGVKVPVAINVNGFPIWLLGLIIVGVIVTCLMIIKRFRK